MAVTAGAATFGRSFDWVSRTVRDGKLPTGVFGASTTTGVIDLAAWGDDHGRAITPDDSFALFPVSKPIIGLLVMQAVETGQLSLDTSLSALMPEREERLGTTIRLHHLLSHTAGLSVPPLDASSNLHDLLLSSTKQFAAGAMAHYSN